MGTNLPGSNQVDINNKATAGGGGGGARSSSLKPLPFAEDGKVRLRFAPEPSGYLHIGHAKAGLLNQVYARQYQGCLIVRFDDTNPEKESLEFVDNILRDIDSLGLKYDEVTYASDHFPQLMEMAEDLIRQGKAYVDDTPKDQIEDERHRGVESKSRANTPDQNMDLWKEMVAGSDRGLQCFVRGKLDMQDENRSLRDPVYYRCIIGKPHPRLGNKYKVYPSYDFSCPYLDSVQGITHALRSTEYTDRNPQYQRIQEDMGVRKVHIVEFSRLNMVYTPLSKRHLKFLVQNGKVDGWDDPRLPTVQGIVRRGVKIEALEKFVAELGASRNLNLMDWDKLWAINKKIIDPVCPRHTAVTEGGRVLLILTNGPDTPEVERVPKHKKYAGAGMKDVTKTSRIWIDQADAKSISMNEEITLVDWQNCIVKQQTKDQDATILQLTGALHPEGNFKTTKLKVTWLPDTRDLVNLSLVHFDFLLTKKSVFSNKKKKNIKMKKEKDSLELDFLEAINPCTKQEISGIGDSNMKELKQGDIIQLERKGYFICDVPFDSSSPSKPVVLFAIPDGRQSTTSSK